MIGEMAADLILAEERAMPLPQQAASAAAGPTPH
jgi:hypothetical protein